MTIRDWGPGHYYPTEKGQRRLRAKDFDPNSSITDYVYLELQSKPWTREMFVREHPEPAGWVFDTSIARGEISPNPRDNVRAAKRYGEAEMVIDSMGNVLDISKSNPYDDPGVIGYDHIPESHYEYAPKHYPISGFQEEWNEEPDDLFDESQVCDICGKYKWQQGHNH